MLCQSIIPYVLQIFLDRRNGSGLFELDINCQIKLKNHIKIDSLVCWEKLWANLF